MANQKRFCKECNEEIYGRRDKQFCSDHCRATHYNNLNADTTGFIRRINYLIRKNRSILCRLNPQGKTRVHKMKLVDSGLNFNYFTNVYKTRSGQTYYFCYDQGYLELDDDYYALIAKENSNGK